MRVTPNYVKEYDLADKRLAWSFLTGPMLDPATGKVLITAHGRSQIHMVDVTMYEATTNWGSCNQDDSACIWKWRFPKGLSSDLENDDAIFGLAGVYLMKTECLTCLNGAIAEEAIDVIFDLTQTPGY